MPLTTRSQGLRHNPTAVSLLLRRCGGSHLAVWAFFGFAFTHGFLLLASLAAWLFLRRSSSSA